MFFEAASLAFAALAVAVVGALIDDAVEKADTTLLAHVGSVAAIFVAPVWGDHYFKDVVYQVLLDSAIHVRGRRQTRACIHLDQPWFQLSVQ